MGGTVQDRIMAYKEIPVSWNNRMQLYCISDNKVEINNYIIIFLYLQRSSTNWKIFSNLFVSTNKLDRLCFQSLLDNILSTTVWLMLVSIFAWRLSISFDIFFRDEYNYSTSFDSKNTELLGKRLNNLRSNVTIYSRVCKKFWV